MLVRLHVVVRVGHDRQAGRRGTHLGRARRDDEQAGGGDDGEEQARQAAAHGSRSSGRRAA